MTSVFLRYFKAIWDKSEYISIKNKIELSLEKEIREMFLWLKISLYNKKQSKESLIFIYEATCGELFSLVEGLEKVIQSEWFRTPTNSSPSLLLELGIE